MSDIGPSAEFIVEFVPSTIPGPSAAFAADFIPGRVLGPSAEFVVGFSVGEVASAVSESALQPQSVNPSSSPAELTLTPTAQYASSAVFEGDLEELVVVDPADLFPAGFSLRRGFEGPQIIIEWGESLDPSQVTLFELVRRRYGYPIDHTDGEVVFSGAAGPQLIADLDVTTCGVYYYKLFITDVLGNVISSKLVQGEIMAIQTGYFGPKLYELLPEAWKVSDKGLEEPIDVRKTLLEGPGSTAEVYNFGETGTVLRGPLQRFLRLVGPILDEIKGLIDCFPEQLDVDDSGTNILRGIARLLGLNLNEELTPEKMRNEVREQVNFLKLKGTIPGIEARLRSVSGLTPIVHEQHQDILYTNDPERTTPAFTVAEAANIGGPNDLLYYTPGYPDTRPFWLWFTVFVQIPDGEGLDFPTLRKWCVSVDDAAPVCHKGELNIETLPAEEPMEAEFVDSFSDETNDEDAMTAPFTDTMTDEQTPDASLWLIISDPTKTLNAPNFQAVFAAPTV